MGVALIRVNTVAHTVSLSLGTGKLTEDKLMKCRRGTCHWTNNYVIQLVVG